MIVTGMSGAGKSTVLKFLEDEGFFCADNLPPSLMSKFAEVCFQPGSEITQAALGIDVRGGRLFDDLFAGLESLRKENLTYTILYLEASDDVLVKRYKETRHSHPLAKGGLITTGIMKEREVLSEVKKTADYIIDTSQVLTNQLKEILNKVFVKKGEFESLTITVISFGYKYGVPEDSDMVFDVRFIPNPFYVGDMREMNGTDKPVDDFVMGFEPGRVFLERLLDMTLFLIPHFIREGKNLLVIGIGCTGGRHRSVTIAGRLGAALSDAGYMANVKHRDINH